MKSILSAVLVGDSPIVKRSSKNRIRKEMSNLKRGGT
jgi:hypothetical protein